MATPIAPKISPGELSGARGSQKAERSSNKAGMDIARLPDWLTKGYLTNVGPDIGIYT